MAKEKPRPVKAVTKLAQQLKRAKARAEQAETRAEQAKTRTEKAEARTEQAETRTEMAKTRTEQAETRAEQAETTAEQTKMALQKAIQKGDLRLEISPPRQLKNITGNAAVKDPLDPLTGRQREILRLIAEGKNTKQIADTLKLSPKTVEYHRLKLMDCLDLHDIPGLVRFALRVGLVPPEG